MPGFQGTYDLNKVSISFKGKSIKGPFGESDVVKITRNEDSWILAIGADGGGARARNNNKSGKIEITVQQSSPANKILSAIAASDEEDGKGVGEFQMKDNSDTGTSAKAENAWITKPADLGRGKEIGTVTWMLESDSIAINHEGLVEA